MDMTLGRYSFGSSGPTETNLFPTPTPTPTPQDQAPLLGETTSGTATPDPQEGRYPRRVLAPTQAPGQAAGLRSHLS